MGNDVDLWEIAKICGKWLKPPSLPEYMQCFAFLSAGTNFSFFGVGLPKLLTASKNFRANLLDCLHVFFFYLGV